tara:strand:+ start:253 stop:1491 length:1239 start_codon:yes stop_codon:yes gene_type:complete
MNSVINKDEIKDYIIISLVKTLAETYSYNYNIDKIIIENHILDKLKQFQILDNNIDNLNIKILKNNLLSSINDIIPKNNTTQNISILNNNLKKILIGSGGFSNVYKVYNTLDKKEYAIKKIGIKNNLKQALFEVRSMAKLNHPNIVRYHTSWIQNDSQDNLDLKPLLLDSNIDYKKSNENNLEENSSEYYPYKESDFNKFICIQMELCNNNLTDFLNKNKQFTIREKKKIVLDIAKGIEYIHNNDVLHRDLKPKNILVNNQNRIKISDFGLATSIYNTDIEYSGTFGYIAPETFNNGVYSKKSDLYSFGIIILEIFFSFNTNMEKMQIISNIKDNKINQNILINTCKETTNEPLLNNISNYFILNSDKGKKKISKKDNTNLIDKDIYYIIKNLIINDPDKRLEINNIIEILT